jgi:glycosyltransferase involved in cell wall biosynthesis
MRLGIYSTMSALPWGGSEHLWSRAARQLLERGHKVAVNYKWWPETPPPLQALRRAGGAVHERDRLVGQFPAAAGVWRVGRAVLRRLGVEPSPPGAEWLRRTRPDCVLVSLGNVQTFPAVAEACRQQGIPYALLVHLAGWHRWLEGDQVPRFRRGYRTAERCFFVSEENRAIAEANLAVPLDQAAVVSNPLPEHLTPVAWPDASDPWRLACMGRLGIQKGQDVILRVLRRRKWRRRPLTVSFYGRDQGNGQQLDALARRYNLAGQVRRPGYVDDPAAIWRRHHALLLPSRYEGMPMVTPEAMACGRVPIVTRCGRNPELVADGGTGFLVEAPTERLLDRALERAWRRRRAWKQMGRRAARRVRSQYSSDPVGAFADALARLAPSR